MWVYVDHNIEQVIFTASNDLSITEADELFKQKFGVLPSHRSQAHVGCYNTEWSVYKNKK